MRGLVEQHGGRVEVHSVPGEGTRFSFTLPVAASPAVDPRPTSAPEGVAARVLVVDDDDDIFAVGYTDVAAGSEQHCDAGSKLLDLDLNLGEILVLCGCRSGCQCRDAKYQAKTHASPCCFRGFV